jgi:RNA polymerase sigma-70 factor (ECF subfamily)
MAMRVQNDFDEPNLIARSQEGDLAAFNLLVEHYQRSLYNLCLRMLNSPQAAEDATQDALIAAYRAIERFRGGGFRAWLFRIAANACHDEQRRRRSRPALSLDTPQGEDQLPIDVPNPGRSLDEHLQQRELGRALQDALARLPSDQRLAIVLCDVQGFDYAEIAEAMNVGLGTVKSRISRARLRLRDLLRASPELLPARFRQSSEDM